MYDLIFTALAITALIYCLRFPSYIVLNATIGGDLATRYLEGCHVAKPKRAKGRYPSEFG